MSFVKCKICCRKRPNKISYKVNIELFYFSLPLVVNTGKLHKLLILRECFGDLYISIIILIIRAP